MRELEGRGAGRGEVRDDLPGAGGGGLRVRDVGIRRQRDINLEEDLIGFTVIDFYSPTKILVENL